MNRADMQPALAKAAEAACIYKMTDGFCHPRNNAACKCWNNAKAVQGATGMSNQAVAWIFRNLQKIEIIANESKDEASK